tara:strand:- start:71 stop:286 length:216 start_codon:yes stop_codon:yes gene_type:complete
MLPFQSMLLAKAEHPVIKFDEHIKSHHALVPFSSAPHFIVLVPSPFLLIILAPSAWRSLTPSSGDHACCGL